MELQNDIVDDNQRKSLSDSSIRKPGKISLQADQSKRHEKTTAVIYCGSYRQTFRQLKPQEVCRGMVWRESRLETLETLVHISEHFIKCWWEKVRKWKADGTWSTKFALKLYIFLLLLSLVSINCSFQGLHYPEPRISWRTQSRHSKICGSIVQMSCINTMPNDGISLWAFKLCPSVFCLTCTKPVKIKLSKLEFIDSSTAVFASCRSLKCLLRYSNAACTLFAAWRLAEAVDSFPCTCSRPLMALHFLEQSTDAQSSITRQAFFAFPSSTFTSTTAFLVFTSCASCRSFLTVGTTTRWLKRQLSSRSCVSWIASSIAIRP